MATDIQIFLKVKRPRRLPGTAPGGRSHATIIKDPGIWPGETDIRDDETPEQRAFRRFPINAHKPGGWK